MFRGGFVFKRYAIFYTPEGQLADWGAGWLGWDSRLGIAPQQPAFAGLDVDALTATPRKYGLHGTLKAPFTLDADADHDALVGAAEQFARRNAPLDAGTLGLRYENGFIALRPLQDPPALRDFAAHTVREFDHLRAPLSAADIARRRKARLSPRQDQQMIVWGYPFIFEDFHFHFTLTGRVNATVAAEVIAVLGPEIAALLPAYLRIDAITLMGEDGDGMFHQIHRYALTG
jgi:hypothetical protein